MATIGSLLDVPNNGTQFEFVVEQLMVPSYEIPTSEYICAIIGPESPWYKEIYAYLQDQQMPPSLLTNKMKSFKRQATRYTLIADTLYRSLDTTLLRCLDMDEAKLALQQVHDGICCAHISWLTLAKKLLRIGYYWLTMEKDTYIYVKWCKQFQIHGDLIHAPAQDLQPITSPWPFSQWGLDLVGKINPTSSNGHKFILTVIEYFTKWVEVIPMTYITGKQIAKFILNYIICRYGIPMSIVIDNGMPFKNHEVKELSEQFHIQQRFATLYYPQSNGQAKATNKTILKILKKVVNEIGWDWHIQLNPSL